jgi:acetyl esterase/lipase
MKEQDKKLGDVDVGRLMSLVSFYPSTDWTQSRAERDASNPENLISVIPPMLFRLFDASYLYPMPDMRSPLLSPGITGDELLRKALPDKLVLINCGGDQLLAETEKFRARLKGLGKRVDGYTVQGVGHAWDKAPTYRKGNVKRDQAYKLATESLRDFWGMEP